MITHHCMLGLISKSFKFFEPEMVSKLYEALVQPILEYSNPIWGPTFILDQRKNWNVQRRATRLVPSIRNNRETGNVRLTFHELRTEARRFKIINNYFNSDFSNMITFSLATTFRGHSFKLFKQQSRLQIHSNFYFNSDWNNIYPKMW